MSADGKCFVLGEASSPSVWPFPAVALIGPPCWYSLSHGQTKRPAQPPLPRVTINKRGGNTLVLCPSSEASHPDMSECRTGDKTTAACKRQEVEDLFSGLGFP